MRSIGSMALRWPAAGGEWHRAAIGLRSRGFSLQQSAVWPAGCRPARGLLFPASASQLQPARILHGRWRAPIVLGLPWQAHQHRGPRQKAGSTTRQPLLFPL